MENSISYDYITEKIWDALSAGVLAAYSTSLPFVTCSTLIEQRCTNLPLLLCRLCSLSIPAQKHMCASAAATL
jgi:hypothetical protein